MIRLTILTQAGLFAVLSIYGGGGGEVGGDRPAPEVAEAAQPDAAPVAVITEAAATQPAAIQPD